MIGFIIGLIIGFIIGAGFVALVIIGEEDQNGKRN